jgi:hypothetical protein
VLAPDPGAAIPIVRLLDAPNAPDTTTSAESP